MSFMLAKTAQVIKLYLYRRERIHMSHMSKCMRHVGSDVYGSAKEVQTKSYHGNSSYIQGIDIQSTRYMSR